MESTDNRYEQNHHSHRHSGHGHGDGTHRWNGGERKHRGRDPKMTGESGEHPMNNQENINRNVHDRQSYGDRPPRKERGFGTDRGSRPGGGDRDRDRGGRGRRGSRGAGYSPLCAEDGTYLLMIGSYSCTRHKGEERLTLQQAGKLGFLCLQEIDWITGDYMAQIEEAAAEVTKQFHVKRLILFGGCQVELQSLDTAMLTEELTAALGIPVEFHRGCHLVGYGDALNRQEETR